jgi:hypothetical protein
MWDKTTDSQIATIMKSKMEKGFHQRRDDNPVRSSLAYTTLT